MNTNKRVIGLVRVSTNQQDLERQRVDVKRVVIAHGLELIRKPDEVGGVSGRSVQYDPTFQAIFRDLKRSDVGGVAISALDRLFRPDFYGDFAILDHFRNNKKLIYSAKEGILDPSSDVGFMLSLMSGAQAGMEWRELRRRSVAGKEVKRTLLRNVNGPATVPRGLKFNDKSGKWSYVEPDRSRILEAYALLFAGDSWRDIARKVGGGWSSEGLRRSLQNSIWKGVRVYPVKTKSSDQRREQPLPVRLPLKPLLTPERWDRAQEIIAARHSKWRKKQRPSSPFLVSGLLTCACGETFYSRTDYRKGQHHTYYCSSRYPNGPGCGVMPLWQENVDGGVQEIVTKHLLATGLLRNILAGANRKQSRSGADSVRIKLVRLEARRKRLLDGMLEGLVSKQEYAEHLRMIETKQRELDTLLPSQEAPLDSRRLVEAIAKAFARFRHLAFDKQRELLQRAVKEITVDDRAIPKLTLSGGFLGELASANLSTRSTLSRLHQFPTQT